MTDEDALSYWTEELGVSTDVLKTAVEKAGPSLKAVRAQLAKS